MRAIIIASGQTGEADRAGAWRKTIRDQDLIIGADGGAARALGWGLVPHLVLGDMDSLADGERARLESLGCRFVVHPRAKDETDLELALTYAAGQGAKEIVILGALGGRLDHTLANLLLLTLPDLEKLPVCIVGGDEEIRLVRSGGTVALEGKPGDLISLLPLGGDARGVTTRGLTWMLRGDTLHFGFSRGVSNEMTGTTAHVEVERGYLLVVHTRKGEHTDEG